MKDVRETSADYVYLGLLLEGVQGSLAEERRIDRNPAKQAKILKKLQGLDRKFSLPFDVHQEAFYNALTEITASYPNLPAVGHLRIGGLSKLSGKGEAKKYYQILIYLAYKSESEILFVYETFIELLYKKTVSEKSEGYWLKCKELIQFIGKPEIAQMYLERVYNKKKSGTRLNDFRKNGKNFCSKLTWHFIDTRPVKAKQRKRGYDDHGFLSAKHKWLPRGGEGGDDYMQESKDIQKMLTEAMIRSTENYQKWLTEQIQKEQEKTSNEEDPRTLSNK